MLKIGYVVIGYKYTYIQQLYFLSAIKVWEDQTSLKFRETTEKHAQEG